MPNLTDLVRVTTRETAVWRTCDACGSLAALPPEVDICPGCQQATDPNQHQPRREDR